jgi:hypothetical protein
MNLFTNVMTMVFWFFTRRCHRIYAGMQDPATGETLTEKSKKFEIGKMLRLPWTFWVVVGLSLFQASTAIVHSQNATEMAEQRFDIDAVTAGWYSASRSILASS